MDSKFVVLDGEKPVYRPVKNTEDAVKYMDDLVTILEEARADLDQTFMTGGLLDAKTAATRWSMRYGQALGALTTLMHTELFGDGEYSKFYSKIHATAQARVIGVGHA